MRSSNLSDEAVVKKVLGEDIDKYEILVKRYEQKLYRYAYSIVGDQHDAKDATQQAFILAYKNLNSFNPKLKFSSWIYRITHNESINIMKKNKKLIKKDKDLILKYTDSGEIPHDEALHKKEIIKLTRDNLNSIPLKYREVLSLYYLEEKSYEEISDILRLPLGTVSTRIRRAKQALKKLFNKDVL